MTVIIIIINTAVKGHFNFDHVCLPVLQVAYWQVNAYI